MITAGSPRLESRLIMSIEQLNLAINTPIRGSSIKFLLVALANYANEDGEAYPSIARLVEITALDRKTVISGLHKLTELGLLLDTKRRRGSTGQVKVWKLQLSVERCPKTEQFQKRNSSVFTPKGSQNRDMDPKGNHFLYFWERYPIKKNRVTAEREWQYLDDEEKQNAIEKIEPFINSIPSWQTIPYPNTYLNQCRWLDDLSPPTKPQQSKKTKLPRNDEQLSSWAIKNGLPGPNRGETFPQYRARLSSLIESRHNQINDK